MLASLLSGFSFIFGRCKEYLKEPRIWNWMAMGICWIWYNIELQSTNINGGIFLERELLLIYLLVEREKRNKLHVCKLILLAIINSIRMLCIIRSKYDLLHTKSLNIVKNLFESSHVYFLFLNWLFIFKHHSLDPFCFTRKKTIWQHW